MVRGNADGITQTGDGYSTQHGGTGSRVSGTGVAAAAGEANANRSLCASRWMWVMHSRSSRWGRTWPLFAVCLVWGLRNEAYEVMTQYYTQRQRVEERKSKSQALVFEASRCFG